MKKLIIAFLFALFVLALPLQIVHAGDVRALVDVSVTSSFDTSNTVSTTVEDQDYGTKISFAASLPGSQTGYEFYCWIVNGVVRTDLAQGAEFIVTEGLSLVGVFHPTDPLKYAVVFMDANGQVLKIEYVASGAGATAPSTTNLSKPGYTVDDETPWDTEFSNVTSNLIVLLQYESVVSELFSVGVTGGTGTNDYAYNSLVTVVADTPETGYFSYWADDNDKPLSYESTYIFTAVRDINLTAVTSESGPTDITYVTLGDRLSFHSGKSSYIGQFHIPSGFTLVEFGTLTFDEIGEFDLTTEGIIKYQGNKYNTLTNEFIASIPSNNSQYIKSYLVVEYTATGNLATVYSAAEKTRDLMFSEYGEGSSGTNKWLEIYNPTLETISLEDYSVEIYINGSLTPATPLTFTSESILAGDVLVIANSATNPAVLSKADIVNNTIANFNGDDALAIKLNGEIIEQFGIIGNDPGTGWLVSGSDYTLDTVLIRTYGLYSPNAVWDSTEWTVHSDTDYTNVGFHVNNAVSSIEITGSSTLMAEKSTQLSITYSPLDAVRDVSWDSSNDSIATVDANGLVTGVAEGEVTITATSDSNASATDTHVITVSPAIYWDITYYSNGGSDVDPDSVLDGTIAEPPTPPTYSGKVFSGWFTDNTTFLNRYTFSTPVTADIDLYAKWITEASYTETFDNFPATGSSYVDGSFTGVNSVLWTYDGARGDQTLGTGKAFCLNRVSNDALASLTATIQGGISSFSIDYKNAFSTAAGVKLYINNVLIGTSTEATGTMLHYSLDNINVSGEFTIKIQTTNGQLTIDNLNWTTYTP